jgi:hypothetical protein
MAMRAKPPTTPPTMAPMGASFLSSDDDPPWFELSLEPLLEESEVDGEGVDALDSVDVLDSGGSTDVLVVSDVVDAGTLDFLVVLLLLSDPDSVSSLSTAVYPPLSSPQHSKFVIHLSLTRFEALAQLGESLIDSLFPLG